MGAHGPVCAKVHTVIIQVSSPAPVEVFGRGWTCWSAVRTREGVVCTMRAVTRCLCAVMSRHGYDVCR